MSQPSNGLKENSPAIRH